MSPIETVPAMFAATAAARGDSEALVDELVRLTFAELDELSERAGRALISLGAQPGDRVAIWAPNSARWVIAALGLLRAGASLVPLNPRFRGYEVRELLRRSGSRILFVTGPFLGADYLEMLSTPAEGIDEEMALDGLQEVICFDDQLRSERARGWDRFLSLADEVDPADLRARSEGLDPDAVSDIMFTSGTTGLSKGVLTAHKQAVGTARVWSECAELTAADRYFVPSPFSHTFGYKTGMLACLATGATLLTAPVFDVAKAVSLLQEERVTVLPGVPTVIQEVLDHPRLPAGSDLHLRIVVTGGTTVPAALVERLRSETEVELVTTAYGLTEAGVVTMCVRGDPPHALSASSGRPVPGYEVEIADSDGGRLPPDEDGEVLVRGANVMLGYMDDPGATASAIDPDGWLHTGDAGRLSEGGYLTITGRLKDVISVGGFNVYPAEVEHALLRHQGVEDAAVVGMPDSRLGEVPYAFVVPSTERTVSVDGLIEFCRENLANFKAPRGLRLVESIPRNAQGKIVRHELPDP